MQKTITFNLTTKATLNSNRMPNAYIVKSKIASSIRKMGIEKGIEEHSDKENAEKRLHCLLLEEDLKISKSRTTKTMNKENASPEDIEKELSKINNSIDNLVLSKNIDVDFMFNTYTVDVTIFSPTKRRVDPPNFYPTVKHLIDGLTFASWWEDDSYDQLRTMSFSYGGLSNIKDTYTFVLDIREIDTDDIKEKHSKVDDK